MPDILTQPITLSFLTHSSPFTALWFGPASLSDLFKCWTISFFDIFCIHMYRIMYKLLFRFNKGAGHYTQVVWAETAEVGCGAIYYEVWIYQSDILFEKTYF